MTTSRKRLLLLLVVGLAGTVFALGTLLKSTDAPNTTQLRDAAKGADRVVIRPQRVVIQGEERNPAPAEFIGGDTVNDLFDQLEFTPPSSPPGVHRFVRCGCDGDFHIEFYRGEKLLVSLGYHHNKLLRWRKGPWQTDVELTERAKHQVPAWFKGRGFTAMAEMYESEGPR